MPSEAANLPVPPLKFLGIPGGIHADSYNRLALAAAGDLLPDGASMDVFDLDGLPLFNSKLAAEPAPMVVEFKRRIREADAILFSVPEYDYAILRVLENAIECGSQPGGDSAWYRKPVAVMGASAKSFGAARAQHYLLRRLGFLNMLPVTQPEVLIGNADQAFDRRGRMVNPASRERVRQLLHNLALWAREIDADHPACHQAASLQPTTASLPQ